MLLPAPAAQCIQQNRSFTFKWQLKFLVMIFFTACLFVFKVVIGYMSNSMALVADSFHMITDLVALLVGFIALRMANSPKGGSAMAFDKYTFGWVRAEVLGGLINTVFLLALCFSVFVSSLKRFVQPEDIHSPRPVLYIGIASLVVNFIGLFMFRTSRELLLCKSCCKKRHTDRSHDPAEHQSLMEETQDKFLGGHSHGADKLLTWENEYQSPETVNIRGVYLHILEHFLSSLIVISSALIVMNVKASWTRFVDPCFTVLLVLLILYSTVPLFRETIILFMQSVPANLKVKELEERLKKKVPGILSVHEFHIWHLGGDQVVASAHILFERPEQYRASSDKVKVFFRNEGIGCMTFQPEFLPANAVNDDAILDRCYNKCSKDKCLEAMCCDAQNNLAKQENACHGNDSHSHGNDSHSHGNDSHSNGDNDSHSHGGNDLHSHCNDSHSHNDSHGHGSQDGHAIGNNHGVQESGSQIDVRDMTTAKESTTKEIHSSYEHVEESVNGEAC